MALQDNKQFIDSERVNIYYASRDKLNANRTSLQQWLDNENKKDLETYHKSFEGIVFKLLGFGKITD